MTEQQSYECFRADFFEISLNQPNQETITAMLEAERIAKDPTVKGYTDLDELFADFVTNREPQ